MEENTDDFIGIKDREKMIIIYNFSEDMKNILKSFFLAHGFFILIGESIHGVIQQCREHVLFLICIYVGALYKKDLAVLENLKNKFNM